MAETTTPTLPSTASSASKGWRRALTWGLIVGTLAVTSLWFLHELRSSSLAAGQRTNILLLGIGGKGHLGGNLADSIIVASISPDRDSATLLSVPRDLYINIADIREAKINAAHAIGEARFDDGIGLIRRTLEETLDIPIHHYLRVDFAGFIDTVDAIGGVEVTFSEPLYDRHFEKEYAVLDFAAGEHTLDGKAALYSARSRMTSRRGDFDRAARQRAILLGVRDKLLTMDVLANPSTVQTVLASAGSHLRTSLSVFDAMVMYNDVKNIKHIDSTGLGDVQGLLTAKRIDGADVLVPAAGHLDEIRGYVRGLFEA